jgi:hypothetical protein
MILPLQVPDDKIDPMNSTSTMTYASRLVLHNKIDIRAKLLLTNLQFVLYLLL